MTISAKVTKTAVRRGRRLRCATETLPRRAVAPQASAADDKLTLILKTAATCFSEQGYEATSLNDVAKRVKLNKATLYHYVDSKHAILYQCLLRSFADHDVALLQMADRSISPIDRLSFFFHNLIHAQNSVFGRCLIMVGAQPLQQEPGGEIRDFQRRLGRAVRAVIDDGIASGSLRNCHSGIASAMLFGAFNWVPRWYDPGRKLTLDRIADVFLDIFTRGIAASPHQAFGGAFASPPAEVRDSTPSASAPVHDDKLTKLLMVAAECFAVQGYDATSLDEIADRVQLHKATLYHYVDSKGALLYQCLVRSFENLDEVLLRLKDPASPPLERLAFFFRHLIFAQNNVFGRCLNLVGPQSLDGEPGAKIKQFQRRLDRAARGLIEEGIADGSMRNCHPGLTATMLFGAANGVPRWYRPERGIPLETIASTFFSIFTDGIALKRV